MLGFYFLSQRRHTNEVALDGSFDCWNAKHERDPGSRFGYFHSRYETLGFAGQMRKVAVEGRQLQLGVIRDVLQKKFELRVEANRQRRRSVGGGGIVPTSAGVGELKEIRQR